MATNTGGPVSLNKNASGDTVANALLTGQNANMDKINTAIDGLNKSVGELGSKDRAIIVSYKYGGDLVDLNNVDVSYLLAFSNSSLNAPAGQGSFWYVETIFLDYPSGNRMQTATSYTLGTTYRRVFHNGTWQPWRLMTAT